MTDFVKRVSHELWTRFLHMTEEPSKKTSEKQADRVLGWVCYILAIILSACLIYFTLSHVDEIQSIEESDHFLTPDLIMCPRPGFAIEIPSDPPSINETTANPDEYRLRRVRWLDSSVMVKRARKHEGYAHTAWYNIEVLDLLQMTKDDVNTLTDLVRSDAQLKATLSTSLRAYLQRLRDLSTESYKHDLKELADADIFGGPGRWRLAIHPRLQEQLATDETESNELRLLWWAIIKSQYVQAYSEQDDPKVHYLKNRRFGCLGCGTGFQLTTLWLDKHLCVAWKPVEKHSVSFYQPDTFDEIQLWAGNIRVRAIEWKDFATPAVDARTKWFDVNLSAADLSANPLVLIEQGMEIFFRAFQMQEKIESSEACQQMIDQQANTQKVRKYYCNTNRTGPMGNVMYLRLYDTPHTHYSLAIKQNEKLSSQPQFSGWQLFSTVGGIIGFVTGLSALQILQTAVTKLRKKLQMAIQLVCMVLLLIVTVIFTYKDISEAMDSKQRYVINPSFAQPSDTPYPTVSFRGGTYFSQLTLNHTKLAEYAVSQSLLRYLCVAATGKSCGTDNKIHSSAPFNQRQRFLKYFTRPYEQLFVVLRPNTTLLGEMEREYTELATTLNVDADTQPAYEVFKHFMLEPCVLVLKCESSVRGAYNCCSEFQMVPYEDSTLVYMLYWHNPNNLTFAEEQFSIYVDTAQYTLHSDGLQPYLGPETQSTSRTASQRWKLNNLLVVNIHSKNGGLEMLKLEGKVVDTMENGDQLNLVLRAKPNHLLPKEQYSKSKCSTSPKCKISPQNFIRYRSLEQRCPCQLKYAETENMIQLDSKKLYCNAREALSCLTKDEFYSGYCHTRPSLGNGNFRVPLFDWDSNDTEHYSLVNPNIYLFSYQTNYACGMNELFMATGSPLGATVSDEDFASCWEVRSCTRFSYEQVAGMSKFLNGTHDPKGGFKLTISLFESADPGTQQIDTFNLSAAIGMSMNSFGLFIGLSFVAIIHIIWLLFEPYFTSSPEHDGSRVEAVQQHWKRSLGFIAPTAAANSSTVNPLAQEAAVEPETEVEETPKWSHVVMIVITIIAFILLVVILIQLVPDISQKFSSTYNVRFNETDIEPSLAICSIEETDFDVDSALTGCEYRGQQMRCSELFPLVWRPNYKEPSVVVSCAVSTQRLHNAVVPVPIDPAQPLYAVDHIKQDVFDRVWVGDLSALHKAKVGQQMLFFELSTTSRRTQLRFITKKYRAFSDCGTEAFPDLKCVAKCAPDQQLFLENHAETDFPAEINNCESVEYEAQLQTGYVTMANHDVGANSIDAATDLGFELLYGDYVWLDVTQRALYNGAWQFVIAGGYFNQFIGLSVLNVVFYVGWLFLQGTIRIVQLLLTRWQPNQQA